MWGCMSVLPVDWGLHESLLNLGVYPGYELGDGESRLLGIRTSREAEAWLSSVSPSWCVPLYRSYPFVLSDCRCLAGVALLCLLVLVCVPSCATISPLSGLSVSVQYFPACSSTLGASSFYIQEAIRCATDRTLPSPPDSMLSVSISCGELGTRASFHHTPFEVGDFSVGMLAVTAIADCCRFGELEFDNLPHHWLNSRTRS